jgi:hypothetical protein
MEQNEVGNDLVTLRGLTASLSGDTLHVTLESFFDSKHRGRVNPQKPRPRPRSK